MTTLEQVIAIINEHNGHNGHDPISETDMLQDLDCDYLDVIAIIMACEEKFGIEIPDDDMEDIQTVADLVDVVEKRRVAA